MMLTASLPGGSDPIARDFVAFAIEAGVLKFGSFVTKAGRRSPYFFNSGLFNDGAKLQRLSDFYARRLIASGIEFEMLFGPAYKGITLAAGTAMVLAGKASGGRAVPFCHDRKEAKDHGEGGTLVGAPLKGRVVIIDDVITDGASKRFAVDLIRANGATPAAVLIALDRKERVGPDDNLSARSAVDEFAAAFGVPVISIASVDHVLHFLSSTQNATLAAHEANVAAYRAKYGSSL